MSPFTIKTYPSQTTWDLLYPNPNSVRLGDMAWALANGAIRFGGHIRAAYSVAQHLVLTHDLVAIGCGARVGDGYDGLCLKDIDAVFSGVREPGEMRAESGLLVKDLAFHLLFHDGHEAYLGDLIGPLKKLLRELGAPFGLASPWDMLELRHDVAIFNALGLGDYWASPYWAELVHSADQEAYRLESKALRSYGQRQDLAALPGGRVLDPIAAANLFLDRVAMYEDGVRRLRRDDESGNIVSIEPEAA